MDRAARAAARFSYGFMQKIVIVYKNKCIFWKHTGEKKPVMKNDDMLTVPALSTQRQILMGTAIVLIMFYHCRAVIPGNSIIWYGYAGIKLFCQIGVDIFLLLSGLGCGYSLAVGGFEEQPVPAARRFWIKRAWRILPKYLLVVAVFCVINALTKETFSWSRVFYQYSLITFFTRGKLTEWYIAAILVFYLLTPFFYSLLKTSSVAYWAVVGVIAALTIVISLSNTSKAFNTVNEIFITRFPVFMTGVALSQRLNKPEGILKECTALCLLAVVLVVYVINRLFNSTNEMCVERLLFWPGSLLLCLLMANGFEKGKLTGSRFFSFFGTITLELYLTHEKIRDFYEWSDAYPWWYGWLFDMATILIAICIALLIHGSFAVLDKRRQVQ